jgi:hypothetical protein
MRLWSLHPKYLDARGLVALWREGLLARKVLIEHTKAYRNHPQLERFKRSSKPTAALDAYLGFVLEEARGRGYKFDVSKIKRPKTFSRIRVTSGQLEFEFDHLLKKLWKRDRKAHKHLREIESLDPNPIFIVVRGEIEDWERL